MTEQCLPRFGGCLRNHGIDSNSLALHQDVRERMKDKKYLA